MPIHLRANPGDYAEACLLPGDPLRAKYIADTFLTDVVQVNAERGLLGFTGRWEGKPISVQGTGMGCPSATIVFEELIQLGVTRLLRVGTCGGLQSDHALGDLIVALSAVPADSTATHLVLGEPHCPTASWELIHEAVHVAKTEKETLRVGPIVSSDLFYNPDPGSVRAVVEARDPRSRDGVRSAVHACRPPRCARRLPVDRQRHPRRRRVRPDRGRRAARRGGPDDADRARDGDGRARSLATTVFLVNPASAAGSTGRRWPEISHRAAALGLKGDALISEEPGQLAGLAEEAVRKGAQLLVVVGGDGSVNEVVNGIAGADEVEIAVIPRGTGWDFARSLGIPRKLEAAVEVALTGETRGIDLGLVTYRTWAGTEARAHFANIGSAGISGAIAKRANETSKALGGKISYYWATLAAFAGWQTGEMRVSVDDEARSGKMIDAMVANGRYLGGGMMMLPDAEPDDGLVRRAPDRRRHEARPPR